MRWRLIGGLTFLVIGLGYAAYQLFFVPDASRTTPSLSDTMQRNAATSTSKPSDPSEELASSNSDSSYELPNPYLGANRWLLATLIVMSISTVVAITVSFYLYYWRRILLSQPDLVVPERWAQYLHGVGRNVEVLGRDIDTLEDSFALGIRQLTERSSIHSKQISDMAETFMTFQNAIDERDTEIRRLKKGYDAEIYRKFLNRFIRVSQSANDCLRSTTAEHEQWKQIRRLFEDAFDECGVEVYEPPLGVDYRNIEGIADMPRIKQSEKLEDAFKIAEVVEAGYRLRGGEVIVPAKVTIFMFEELGVVDGSDHRN